MVLTASTMVKLGMQAPDFSLPDVRTGENLVSLEQSMGTHGLVVAFICNHCPYVIHIREKLAGCAKQYQSQQVGVVAINANNIDQYDADSPQNMKLEVARAGYTFPYLFDRTQEVAKAYGAACTPDFFLFDNEMKLVYRGQFDNSRPGSRTPVTGSDLNAAVEALLSGGYIAEKNQIPSMGCNIKWKPGNEPPYA